MKKDSVMKKLFKYIGKYWILLILSIILAGISVVLQLYVPVLFGNAIDEIIAAHNVDFTQMWIYLKQYPKLTGDANHTIDLHPRFIIYFYPSSLVFKQFL